MSDLDKYGHHLRLCSKAPCICGLEEAIQRARESVHVSDVPSAALWADLRAQLAQALKERDEARAWLKPCCPDHDAMSKAQTCADLTRDLLKAYAERDEARECLDARGKLTTDCCCPVCCLRAERDTLKADLERLREP